MTLDGGEELEGALVVGADGVRSLVRERLWGDGPAVPSGDVAWRAVVSAGDELAPLDGESWGRGLLFGAVPLRGERIYWFAGAAADERGDADPERERDLLEARFAELDRSGRAAHPAHRPDDDHPHAAPGARGRGAARTRPRRAAR